MGPGHGQVLPGVGVYVAVQGGALPLHSGDVLLHHGDTGGVWEGGRRVICRLLTYSHSHIMSSLAPVFMGTAITSFMA